MKGHIFRTVIGATCVSEQGDAKQLTGKDRKGETEEHGQVPRVAMDYFYTNAKRQGRRCKPSVRHDRRGDR